MTLLAAVASAPLALAVTPLVTDDADTVERGHVQLNGGWQFSRTGSASSHTVPVNPVFGLSPRGELGATFGYQWRAGVGRAPKQADADGITDLMLETKWRLWQQPADGFKLSVRFDLKLPTASEHRGLGTGHADLGALLAATRCWGSTCLDTNVGYTAIDASRRIFRDNRWFVGQTVRHDLMERLTLIGETYALLPHGKTSTSATAHFNGGAQVAVHENLLLSAFSAPASALTVPP